VRTTTERIGTYRDWSRQAHSQLRHRVKQTLTGNKARDRCQTTGQFPCGTSRLIQGLSGNNHELAHRVLEQGGTVAVVFWPEVPQTFWGCTVIDGDAHDARFLDPAGTIVGLKAKGSAKSDLTGFVIRQQPVPQSSEQFAMAA